MSIPGGVSNAPGRAYDIGCKSLQIFTKNANRWFAKPLSDEEAKRFKEELAAADIHPWHAVAHDSYLINLASSDNTLHGKSMELFLDEYRRTEKLGLAGLVFHPGAHVGLGEEAGVRTVGDSLRLIMNETSGFEAKILIETTAGQGSSLGFTFEQIAGIMERSRNPDRMGVCLDTCHIFAAGYDFRTSEGYAEVMEKFDQLIGKGSIRVIHINDSKKCLGSRVDRHQHIGDGEIGLLPFAHFLNDQEFDDIPGILETPKRLEDEEMDPVNLARLESLVEN